MVQVIVFAGYFSGGASAQFPHPALVGYFHNWNTANAPYISLTNVDTRYNIINVAFATPVGLTDYRMEFTPAGVSQSTFISQIQVLQGQGRIVSISVGGATAPISLHTTAERDSFVQTMSAIIDLYGFDGMDIDFEGSSLSITGGTITSPVDLPVIHLIEAIREIMRRYFDAQHKKMFLSMAPETAFVQGGQSAFGGVWGAYLPVVHALRDSIELLHVQLYNSGTMYGIDRKIYTQGTCDFIVAMAEAVIQGFRTTGGIFPGLPARKIAIGLPACSRAAGGGYTPPDSVKAAMSYLLGSGPRPGVYSLANPSGYPDLRGMMTWSINWDASAACAIPFEFATTYASIFRAGATSIAGIVASADVPQIFPNPAIAGQLVSIETVEPMATLSIHDYLGREMLKLSPMESSVRTSIQAPARGGIYFVISRSKKGRMQVGRILVSPG